MNIEGINFFAYLEMPLNSLPCHQQPFSAKRPRLELKSSITFAFKMFGPKGPLPSPVNCCIYTATEVSGRIAVLRGEWPSGLYSLRQVTEVKLGRVRSDFGWVTSED